ncbi:REP-associated tyrosine transposase [Polluticoccus soli]|uniref:REP-associated tyrosine transposase n=1 Tax=Polluticoccus soli TaxID=3034150 RepID=UPI0023E34858|nr:transposase [Flavipsychrobacter sp. JY13-12]
MATRYRFGDSYIPHFITFSVINWIDALSRPHYKDIVVDSLKYCIANKGLTIHSWVIMNNHVHMIISAEGDSQLADIVRDFKKFTAAKLLEAVDQSSESRRSWMMWLFGAAGRANTNNTHYQFWQQDNHPIALNNHPIAQQKIDYIHDNPVRAGIVFAPEHYIYSSAVDYYDIQKGLLPVELLI